MKQKASKPLLLDMERCKYTYTGLGYYCQCLERGLREVAPDLRLHYYGEPLDKTQRYSAFKPWHRTFNPIPFLGFGAIHITYQLQKYMRYVPNIPHIITLHDLNFLHEELTPHRYESWKRRVIRNLNRADVIICITDFVRQDLMRNIDLFSLKPNVRIEVVHNGIDLEPTGYSRPDVMDSLQGAEYLLCIGSITHKKKQINLVRMMPHLPETLHLVLVHSDYRPSYYEELLATIDKLGLAKRIHLVESVSDEEKSYLLQHCRAYVHPSTAEGFGIPPIEAMVQGRPTFLSTATSLPEVGGREAYYFEDLDPEAMANAYLQGIADYDAQPDKPERIRAWAQQYDYRRMAEGYYRIYQEVLGL